MARQKGRSSGHSRKARPDPERGEVTLTLPQAMQRAAAAYGKSSWTEAEQLCRRVLDASPEYFDALKLLGFIAAKTQRPKEAAHLFRRAIAVKPADAQAHNGYGGVLRELKRLDESLASYDEALRINSGYAEAHNNRGNVLRDLGRYDDSLSSYDRALQISPDYAEASYNRGVTLQDLGRLEDALASYASALRIKPDYAEAWQNQGNVLRHLGRLDEALASYARALDIRPNYAEACFNRGVALQDLQRFDEAVASYDRALAINPDYAEACNNRGNALHSLGRCEDALASYRRALAIKPAYARAYNNRGNTLRDLGRLDEALESYDRSLEIKPDYAEAHYNRGIALQDLRRLAEALASYDRALEIRPRYANALNNRGNVLREFKRLGEALACYEGALQVDPGHVNANWNRALWRLMMGDFARGWEGYEWRWETEQIGKTKRHFRQPLWLGKEPLAGKTILLHAEQGLGDAIQFCRYCKRVADLGAKVILEVDKSLAPLLRHMNGIEQLVVRGDVLPDFDFQCPLLSLPLAFKTDITNIPAPERYVYAPTERTRKWRARLGDRTAPRVGLVWSGSTLHANDFNRSIALARLLEYLPSGYQYVSLQKELRDTDAQTLSAHNGILHLGSEMRDFADTAALCEQMDLVISVDTSVAHLAGALGRPVWILLPFIPDWRWLLDRDDSPWYPTAKLYRQRRMDDWAGVLERVRRDLLVAFPVAH